MRSVYGDGRRISNAFFTQSKHDENLYICKCKTTRRKTGTSYANLISHVRTAHPDYRQMITPDGVMKQTEIEKFFHTSKARHLHGWLNLIIHGLLPFSTVQNKVFRENVKHEYVSISTIMRYISGLTALVEEKISSLLPSKFCLVFDGWSSNLTHFIAVFATFPSDNHCGYSARLLTVSPIGDECSLNADDHIDFLKYILELYGKTWSNVIALVGDNVSVNKSISNKTGKPLIGCASHRYNLAVRDIIDGDIDLIDKIAAIMVKLKTLLLSAQLRKLTHLRPRLRNVTRWSSTFSMISRYRELKEFLPKLNSDVIDEISLTTPENRRVDELYEKFTVFESVTKALQKDNTSLADVRALFDATIDEHPTTYCRLSSTADIVHCPWFESALVKVQRGMIAVLSIEEQVFMACFENESLSNDDVCDEELSFVERALKRQRCQREISPHKYMDTRFVLATSNICERLFSRMGYTMTDRRRGLTPANLEAQIFLNLNSDLWGIDDVNKLSIN